MHYYTLTVICIIKSSLKKKREKKWSICMRFTTDTFAQNKMSFMIKILYY